MKEFQEITSDKIQELVTRMTEAQQKMLEYRLITDYSEALCLHVIESTPVWWYYLIPGKVKRFRLYQDYCKKILERRKDEHIQRVTKPGL